MAMSWTELRDEIDDFESAASGIQAMFATLVTKRDGLTSQLNTDGVSNLYGPAYDIFDRAKSCLEVAQSDLVALFHQRILDRTKTQVVFPQLYDGTLDEALQAIYEDMVEAGSIVTANTVSCSTPAKTAVGINTGNLYVTAKLPGNIAPGEGLRKYHGFFNLNNQMAEADSVVCLTRDGVTAYVSGKPPRTVPYGGETSFGNRGFAAIPCDGSGQLVSNFFESFTSNTPDGWTIGTGTAGTEVLEKSGLAVRGSKSLELNGNSALTYPIASLVQGRQNLLLSVWARKHASTAAGTVYIRMKGTGMTTQETNFTASGLSSSAWTEKTLHCSVPAVIPADLSIEVATTSVSASGVYVDAGLLQPYVYWAGFGWGITLGADNYVAGDKWTATISNTYASARQTWMARSCGFQLPT